MKLLIIPGLVGARWCRQVNFLSTNVTMFGSDNRVGPAMAEIAQGLAHPVVLALVYSCFTQKASLEQPWQHMVSISISISIYIYIYIHIFEHYFEFRLLTIILATRPEICANPLLSLGLWSEYERIWVHMVTRCYQLLPAYLWPICTLCSWVMT